MPQSAARITATGRKAGRKPRSVAEVKLKSATGDVVVVTSIDGNSETFADDFLYVFTRNVRSARAENKKKLGARSGGKKEKV